MMNEASELSKCDLTPGSGRMFRCHEAIHCYVETSDVSIDLDSKGGNIEGR